MKLTVLILFLVVILSDAAGDAFNDSGRKVLGHILCAIAVLLLLISPFLIKDVSIGFYIAAFICLRIALFDIVYNLTKGSKWYYIGNSGLWDKFLRLIDPGKHLIVGRIIFLIAGLGMIITSVTN